MRLKNALRLITEKEGLRDLKKDCQTFMEKSEAILSEDFYLARASKNDYNGATFRPSRERKFIRGSNDMFYFYNKFRPSNVPPRHKQVPCTGGSVSGTFQSEAQNSYAVFPVGSRYKMIYTEGVPDFNSPSDDELYKAPRSPLFTISEKYWNELNGEIESRWDREIGNMLSRVDQGDMSNKPGEITSAFDYLVEFMLKYEEDIKHYFPEAYESLDEYKEYFEKFFSKTNVVDKLEKEMDGLEVGLFAPDGFYYLEPKFLSDL